MCLNDSLESFWLEDLTMHSQLCTRLKYLQIMVNYKKNWVRFLSILTDRISVYRWSRIDRIQLFNLLDIVLLLIGKTEFEMTDILHNENDRNMTHYRKYRDGIIRHNSFFTKLRKIPPKGHKCTHQQRNSKEYRHTSIVSADNQMDRLKSESNLEEIDPEINLMQAPPLDLSSLKASNLSLQDTPQISQDAEGVAQQDHSSVPQHTVPGKLPVPQKIACLSFGNSSSSNSNDRVSTDNHNTPENRHLSSSSDQRKGVGHVHDVHTTSEESQFQRALRQPPFRRPVCVGDPDYTLHTMGSATSSRRAPQPEQRSDRPLPQVLGIDDLPSGNLTNWFSSQQPVTSEGTATQPQPIPTRVSMDQIPLGSSWNDVQKPFELFPLVKMRAFLKKQCSNSRTCCGETCARQVNWITLLHALLDENLSPRTGNQPDLRGPLLIKRLYINHWPCLCNLFMCIYYWHCLHQMCLPMYPCIHTNHVPTSRHASSLPGKFNNP